MDSGHPTNPLYNLNSQGLFESLRTNTPGRNVQCHVGNSMILGKEGGKNLGQLGICFLGDFDTGLYHMDVSKNGGFSPQIIHEIIGFSIINHPFRGTPDFGNHYIMGFITIKPPYLDLRLMDMNGYWMVLVLVTVGRSQISDQEIREWWLSHPIERYQQATSRGSFHTSQTGDYLEGCVWRCQKEKRLIEQSSKALVTFHKDPLKFWLVTLPGTNSSHLKKSMVGILVSFWGPAYFQVLC